MTYIRVNPVPSALGGAPPLSIYLCMGNKREPRGGPPPAFWIKVALAASFVGPLLPPWIAFLLGVIVLALPRWWFRP